MDASPFDPSAITADELAARYPDMGLFVAEDIAQWRKDHGAFPDRAALVSLGVVEHLLDPITAACAAPTATPEVATKPTITATPPPAKQPEASPSDAPNLSDLPGVLPKRRPRARFIALSALISVVAATGTAVVTNRLEQKRARAPLAAVAAEVHALEASEAATKTEADATRSKVDELAGRLDEQEKLLTKTRESVSENEKRRAEAERKQHDHDAEESRDRAQLAARMGRAEQKTYKLEQALEILDALEKTSAPSTPVREPVVDEHHH